MEQAMDFNMLTRRELQALCKKNKIPANITNVAMIDSLKALEIIEGIEDILPTSESETAQSSIDSPVRSEVTSPRVPQSGGRTTRRRTAVKGETESAKPTIRAQRTTRKSRVIDADESQAAAIETPAVAPQTNRKKVQMASACRKMDSQFEGCVEEEKKDVLATPAPSGVTSRRRRGAKEESEVKRVYSTRRSVRLLEKNKELTNEVVNGNHDFSKKELFTNDSQESEMNTKESMDDLDGMSGITGAIDAITLEENSEKKDEVEVLSAEKQETSLVKVEEVVPPVDEVTMISHSEADLVNSELERCHAEIEEAQKYENKADLEEECDGTGAPNDEITPQEDYVTLDVQTSDIEMGFEIIEKNAKDAGCDGNNYGENAGLEIGDVAEIYSEVDTHSETEKEISNEDGLDSGDDTVLNAKEGVLEINGSHDVKPSEVEKPEEQNTCEDAGFEDEVADGETFVLESEDNFAIGEDSFGTNNHNEIEKDVSSDDYGLDSEENMEVLETNAENEFKPDESESLSSEATEESLPFDITLMNEEDEASWDAVFSYVNEKHDAIEANPITESELQLQQPITEDTPLSEKELNNIANEMVYTTKPEEEAFNRVVEPASASKASSAKKKRINAVTDNKENIGSGGKIVLTKERVKVAKKKSSKNGIQDLDLGELSVRQLTKMLKEKLEITHNPPTKNEDATMVSALPARPALQALPENRLAN